MTETRVRLLALSEFFPHASHVHEGICAKEQLENTPDIDLEMIFAPRLIYPPFRRYKSQRYTGEISDDKVALPKKRIHMPYVPKIAEYYLPWLYFKFVAIVFKNMGLRCNLIHTHWAYRSGYAGAKLARLLGVPLVISVWGSDLHTWLQEERKQHKIRYALRHASIIIVVNKEFRSILVAEGISQRRIRIISPGVSLQKFRPESSIEAEGIRKAYRQRFLIVCIANLYPIKGIDLLLNARALMKKQAEILIVGEGPEKLRLENLVETLQLWDSVTFKPQCPHQKVSTYLNAADLVCIPSEREGGPVILLEALACGRPVVSADVGYAAACLTRRDIGIVLDERSPACLAQALDEAAGKRWITAKIRRHALQFCIKKSGAEIQQAYQDALAQG